MSDIRIIFEDDEFIEYEVTQPNNLRGDTDFWNDDDWVTWNEKMDRLEKEGTVGQNETFTFKLKKNPFIDGSSII